MEKIKVSQAIIVEGKYDKIKLSSFIDGIIICTNGFRIFKDKEMAELIRYYAEKSGIIILTDSDTAGFRIRGHLKGICPKGSIINLYIPDVFGKEKRKAVPSKEGKLGVEGIDVSLLRKTFEEAGITGETVPEREHVSRLDFYELGITGCDGSSALRRRIAAALELPQLLTSNALLEVTNTMFGRQEFFDFVNELKERADNT